MLQEIKKIVDKTQEKKRKTQEEVQEIQDEKKTNDIAIYSPGCRYLIECDAEMTPPQEEQEDLQKKYSEIN